MALGHQLGAFWNSSSDDERVYSALATIQEETAAFARDRGADLEFLYMNDASADQDVVAGYGEESVRRLRQASRKYDPEGVFQTLMPGGFKL